MSDWKNASAEAEMRKAEAEMMEKAKAKRIAEEDAAWVGFSYDLYHGDSEVELSYHNQLISYMRKKYNLPTLKS